MGEAIRGVPGPPEVDAPPAADAGEPFSIGSWFRTQRSLRGLSLDDLAAHTHIPRRSLERLESGAFDGAQDGFTRGFVRTVAVALGLDPDQAVSRLLHEPDAGETRRPGPLLRRRAVFAAAAVAVLVLVWLFASRVREPAAPAGLEPAARPDVVLRRDAVRALAAERGLLAPPSRADATAPAE